MFIVDDPTADLALQECKHRCDNFAVAHERARFAVEHGSRDAIHHCAAVVELARGQEDPRREIDALLLLGTAYCLAGQKRKALAARLAAWPFLETRIFSLKPPNY